MTTTPMPTTNQHGEQRDAFVESLLNSTAGLFKIFSVYLGDRLGFYHALAQSHGMTSTELASRTQTNERYAREWLEQQTVAGILTVADETEDALARCYAIVLPRHRHHRDR
jgi:hypothetical protein